MHRQAERQASSAPLATAEQELWIVLVADHKVQGTADLTTEVGYDFSPVQIEFFYRWSQVAGQSRELEACSPITILTRGSRTAFTRSKAPAR